jgi:AbrB family looped-hinge helix DNA binding protein
VKTIIDKAGRIIIPKEIREKSMLVPGSELEITIEDMSIVIRKKEGGSILKQKNGFFVLDVDLVGDFNIPSVLDELRNEREGRVIGI